VKCHKNFIQRRPLKKTDFEYKICIFVKQPYREITARVGFLQMLGCFTVDLVRCMLDYSSVMSKKSKITKVKM